jgi:hypothetical protein
VDLLERRNKDGILIGAYYSQWARTLPCTRSTVIGSTTA